MPCDSSSSLRGEMSLARNLISAVDRQHVSGRNGELCIGAFQLRRHSGLRGGTMGDRSVRIPRRDVELYRSGRAGRGLDVGDAIHTGQSGDAAALGFGAASFFGVIAASLSITLLALILVNRHSERVSMQS